MQGLTKYGIDIDDFHSEWDLTTLSIRDSIITRGQILEKIKPKLKGRENDKLWVKFLEEEAQISTKTAYNYILAAENYRKICNSYKDENNQNNQIKISAKALYTINKDDYDFESIKKDLSDGISINDRNCEDYRVIQLVKNITPKNKKNEENHESKNTPPLTIISDPETGSASEDGELFEEPDYVLDTEIALSKLIGSYRGIRIDELDNTDRLKYIRIIETLFECAYQGLSTLSPPEKEQIEKRYIYISYEGVGNNGSLSNKISGDRQPEEEKKSTVDIDSVLEAWVRYQQKCNDRYIPLRNSLIDKFKKEFEKFMEETETSCEYHIQVIDELAMGDKHWSEKVVSLGIYKDKFDWIRADINTRNGKKNKIGTLAQSNRDYIAKMGAL